MLKLLLLLLLCSCFIFLKVVRYENEEGSGRGGIFDVEVIENKKRNEVEVGSIDGFVIFDDKCASWNAVSNTLFSHTKSSKKYSNNFAISSHPLSRDKVSRWKVIVMDVSDNVLLFVGIIGKNVVSDILCSFDDSTSCVWGSGNGYSSFWVNGERNMDREGGTWLSREDSGRRGTEGEGSVWTEGDEAVFSYSPVTGVLEMIRYNTTYLINTNTSTSFSSPSQPVYLQFWFNEVGTKLKIEMI